MWRNSAGIVLCFQKLSSSVVSGSLLRTTCGKTVPLLYEKITEPFNNFVKPVEVLFVKRSSFSGFMANVHALPGGNIDDADSCREWINVFNHDLSLPSFKLPSNLPIYKSFNKGDCLSEEIAYRICAIRELFEETGILLARKKEEVVDFPVNGLSPGTVSPVVMSLSDATLSQWRERVHDNAYNFITMCRELGCVPDIYSLIEWSNHITPWNSKRRYDTIFYLACLERKPKVSPDSSEITKISWMSPNEVLDMQFQGQLLLAPPQFCDMTLLSMLADVPTIHGFTMYSRIQGSLKRRVGIRVLCKDSTFVMLSMKDDMYPPTDQTYPCDSGYVISTTKSPIEFKTDTHNHFTEYVCSAHTSSELRDLAVTMNRVEMSGRYIGMKFYDNVETNEVDSFLELYNSKIIPSKL